MDGLRKVVRDHGGLYPTIFVIPNDIPNDSCLNSTKFWKPLFSIGSWFHWWVARGPSEYNESGEPIHENLYYFQYRLGETYGTSEKNIPFRSNVWQKEMN